MSCWLLIYFVVPFETRRFVNFFILFLKAYRILLHLILPSDIQLFLCYKIYQLIVLWFYFFPQDYWFDFNFMKESNHEELHPTCQQFDTNWILKSSLNKPVEDFSANATKAVRVIWVVSGEEVWSPSTEHKKIWLIVSPIYRFRGTKLCYHVTILTYYLILFQFNFQLVVCVVVNAIPINI